MTEIKFEDIIQVLDCAEDAMKVAEAAAAWRQALLGGRFDKAQDKLITLSALTDEYMAKWHPEP